MRTNNEQHIAAAEAHDMAARAHEERSPRAYAVFTAAASAATRDAPRCAAFGPAGSADVEASEANENRVDGEGRAADAAHDWAALFHRAAAAEHRIAAGIRHWAVWTQHDADAPYGLFADAEMEALTGIEPDEAAYSVDAFGWAGGEIDVVPCAVMVVDAVPCDAARRYMAATNDA